MEAKEQVLNAMREAGAPVNAGKVAEMTGLDRKVVDKAFADLKTEAQLTIQFQLVVHSDYAGCHLQRTGETIAPSFLRSAKALSTTLRSRPVSSAILPAFTGAPTSRIAFNT